MSPVTVAAVRAAPEFLDRDATIGKVVPPPPLLPLSPTLLSHTALRSSSPALSRQSAN